jgi:hypothetical protein
MTDSSDFTKGFVETPSRREPLGKSEKSVKASYEGGETIEFEGLDA